MNQSYQRQAIGSWSTMALLLWIGCFVGSIAAAAVTPQIAAGGEHTVALKSDSTVVAWGAGATNTGTWPLNMVKV